MKRISLSALAVALAAVQVPLAAQAAPAVMDPAQAIAAVAAATDGQVAGVFDMVVGSAGSAGYQVYLNSAKDYHDPANLTIELDPGPRAKLNGQIGGEAETLMPGKHIRVRGVAKRIAIPHRDGTKAYQTRVKVETNDQLTLIN